jgi:cytochrome c oxidase subunit 2
VAASASRGPLRRELVELAATGALAAGLLLAAWASNNRADAAPAAPPAGAVALVAQGRQLFQSKGCVGCHTAPGLSARVPAGPDLTTLAADAPTRRPPLSAEEHVRLSIREPAGFVRDGFVYGVEMPRLAVSERELDALVAFLLAP